jgi:beta-phosphoglucomutase-like phosphatase (HAD superfamily)
MPLELERVKALCFDLDGTLRNTDDMYVARLSGWLRPFQAIMPDQNPEKFARRLVMKVERPGYFFFHILDRLHLDQYLSIPPAASGNVCVPTPQNIT